MTACGAAKERSIQRRAIVPLHVLIVAELSTCTETIRALLELQDFGFIQIIGRVESETEVLQALTVLAPDLVILDHRQDMGPPPLSSVLASKFPAIKVLSFAEKDLVRLTEAILTCQIQLIFSRTTLCRNLAAALEHISGFGQFLEPED
jgi:DNA-binding NarL/FixJ family response regulator